ncbi:MAG TPA: glycerophosphodiester phosphodiesterase family protein [Streptosporangiaceae bacterium]|nr:glycerophosphodiester phosphodiesterase family protein [Streptosporangiaceae bacterium]
MERSGWLVSRPIAHRGLYDEARGRPENSLSAFRYAAERGVPIELDVQLARDGLLVVVHDTNLARVAGLDRPVSDLDRASLRRLRIGSDGEPIPTLGDALAAVACRVPIVIDVRRWRAGRSADLERAVAGEISGYSGELALQSFDPLAVFRLRRLAGDRPVGQASGLLRSAGRVAGAIGRSMVTNFATRPDFVSYELAALPSRSTEFWRRRGIPVLAFTVSSGAAEARAAELADNFFFSDYLPEIYRENATP